MTNIHIYLLGWVDKAYFAARLRLTMIRPAKTRVVARDFCHVRVSMPMAMLIAMAMIGCT